MIAWWWLLIVGCLGFIFGLFIFSLRKISADTERMWKGYYKKIEEEEKGEEK